MPTKRCRARCGPYPHPILGDALQARQPCLHQRREAVRQQLRQHVSMVDAKVRQRFGVHADPAAQPLEREMLLAQTRDFTGAANPLHGGIQPQRHQDARVRRRMAGMPLHRLDRRQQRRQVEPLDKPPDQTHPMVLLHQLVEAERAPFDLAALGITQPRCAAAQPFRRFLIGQSLEQHSHFTRCHHVTFTNPKRGDSSCRISGLHVTRRSGGKIFSL